MRDSKFYICDYCFTEYIPRRRGAQKYCSSSCRSRACQLRKANRTKTDALVPEAKAISNPQTKQMTLAGVGESAAGALAANLIIDLFTKEPNKAATKGDLKLLIETLKARYHLVKNMDRDQYGRYPYFDLVENIVVYRSVLPN
jgi:hypothetical protein